MKIVQILGGLGNQMFQYAFLLALREHYGENILMDTGAFKGYPLHNGFELDTIFSISAQMAQKKDVKRIYHRFLSGYNSYRIYKHLFPAGGKECREKAAMAFNSNVFEKKSDCYYDGYWQDYRYFEKIHDVIKKEFTYKTALSSQNAVAARNFSEELTVSLHIRRGDYNGNKTFGGVCDSQYYIKALKLIKDRFPEIRNYAIFSNDLKWCQETICPSIPPQFQIISVDWNKGFDSYVDMRLMSCCKINVIANSSFSWWAAFLNIHKDSVVIAPKIWTNNGQTAVRQLPSWVLL